MKDVLILGAGLVAKPIVEYLLENGFTLTIASRSVGKAAYLIHSNPQGEAVAWTVDNKSALEDMIRNHRITVSLLPPGFHVEVAGSCLRNRKPMVTTSYVKKEMQDLNDDAIKAGVLILNEMGLDPGIDHMSAMKIIDNVHDKGGKVDDFYSICGALPAPEAADNPFRYKFTWSPAGVIQASKNGALYMKNGKKVTVDGEKLFSDRFETDFPGIGSLEVYPNRDSVSYIDVYGIPEARTIFRGTFRFRGWCEALDVMKSIGMLDDNIRDYTGFTYADFIKERAGITGKDIPGSLREVLNLRENDIALKALEWLGFFTDTDMGHTHISPFGITSGLMIGKMSLKKDERDMIVLQHIVNTSYPGGRKETIKASLVDFGTPATNTAVARTVAFPAAIAVKLILTGEMILSGVHRPVLPEIYNPVLRELENLGIKMHEELTEMS